MDQEFWNKRYGQNESVYGDGPNEFFRDQLSKLSPGKLLLPAEGEGRNAIFAAVQGWQVDAFDFSATARNKALQRAADQQVTVNYWQDSFEDVKLPAEGYDVIALLYVHMASTIRSTFLAKCIQALKPGGVFILEGFHPGQLSYSSGGPKDRSYLYDIEAVRVDLAKLQLTLCREEDITLNEGPFHQGKAAVVRVVGKK